MRPISPIEQLFEFGKIHLSTNQIHTVHPLEVDIPKGKLTVVTGVSGSGKTTMILESLLPAIQTKINDSSLPDHIKDVQMEGIEHIKLLVLIFVRLLLLILMFMMNLEKDLPKQKALSLRGIKQEIFLIIQESLDVQLVMEQGH